MALLELLPQRTDFSKRNVYAVPPLAWGIGDWDTAGESHSLHHSRDILHSHLCCCGWYFLLNYSLAAQNISQSRAGFLQYTGCAIVHEIFVLSLEGYLVVSIIKNKVDCICLLF